MKLAPILPTAAVDLIDTGYNLCFAEIALENDFYAAVFRERAARGDVVILDTMVFERKAPIHPNDWHEAIERVQPTAACIPDVLDNAELTIKQFHSLTRNWEHHHKAAAMAVVQGKTIQEYVACALELARHTQYLAMVVHHADGTRLRRDIVFRLLDEAGFFETYPNHKIHLLGAESHVMADERAGIKYPQIMGVDTAKPASGGLNGYSLATSITREHYKRPKDFFDIPRERVLECLPLIQQNVDIMSRLLGGK